MIARSILVDIRMNPVALVFDSTIEAAHGAPIQAELVESRAEKYELKWQVQAQAMPASAASAPATDGKRPCLIMRR
ncbi:MAG: hypothetical protein R3D85_10960 [Paracoccaceae bacterium]